jgi:hypothetical protein
MTARSRAVLPRLLTILASTLLLYAAISIVRTGPPPRERTSRPARVAGLAPARTVP